MLCSFPERNEMRYYCVEQYLKVDLNTEFTKCMKSESGCEDTAPHTNVSPTLQKNKGSLIRLSRENENFKKCSKF